MSTVVGWVIFTALCGLVWLFSGSLPFQSEVIVYNAFCPTPRVNEKCAAGEEVANPTTYKALLDQQTVVYWVARSDKVFKHEHCAVRDEKNWSCHADASNGDRIYEYTLIDGQYREVGKYSDRTSIFYQVPKWKWYWINLKSHA